MAQAKKENILSKFPWLPFATGGVLIVWILYAVFSYTTYQAAKKLHTATIAEIASDKPTSGQYKVTGGVMNYVYAEAVGFTNDKDKDAGADYTSYVPYIDPQTKNVVMLVQVEHYSPKDFTLLIDDGKPQQQIGQFVNPGTVDPKLYGMFTQRGYTVAQDTPVLVQFGAPPDPTGKIIAAGIFVLLLSAVGWGTCYLLAKPKVRRKSFSERYPDRKVY